MPRNHTLDVLRGIAIAQVFFWHVFAAILEKYFPFFGKLASLTWTGVDLFFVLSGYLIGNILMNNRGADNYYSVFYMRRFLRIIPLYIITLLIFFAIWPSEFNPSYFVFAQNISWAAKDQFGPQAIAVTWSLAVEEQFYLVLPALIALCSKRHLPKILIALIVAAPLFRAVAFTFDTPHAAYLLLPCRMDALMIGVLIAWAMRDPFWAATLQRRSRVVGALALGGLVGMVLLALTGTGPLDPFMSVFGYSYIAVFYGLMLLWVVAADYRAPAIAEPLRWAGLGAYSIYLFHTMIAMGSHALLAPIPATIAACVATAAIAWACYKLIEKPCIELGHRRFRIGVKKFDDQQFPAI